MTSKVVAGPRLCRGFACLTLLAGLAWTAAAAAPGAGQLNEAGVRLTGQGRYEEAAEAFARALSLLPGDPVIRRNYARLRTAQGHRFLAAGRLDRAREAYQAALELSSEESAAYLGLGDVKLHQRDPRGAAESYRLAIGLTPGSPVGHQRLGEAYYHQGDLAGALGEWETALQFSPADERLRQRVDRVRQEVRIREGYGSGESQHFRVSYEGGRREELGRELLAILERAYVEVGYELGAYPAYEVETIFYTDRDFVDATGLSPQVGGFYHLPDGKIRLAVRGLKAAAPKLRAILYHEYTHALIYAATRGNNPPRWLHEGLAIQMEGLRAPAFRVEAVRLAQAGRLPLPDEAPYLVGSAATGYLIERYGVTGIQELLRRLGEGMTFAGAFRTAFGLETEAFPLRLREILGRGY